MLIPVTEKIPQNIQRITITPDTVKEFNKITVWLYAVGDIQMKVGDKDGIQLFYITYDGPDPSPLFFQDHGTVFSAH